MSWARKRGYWARKFSSPANRSVPDYLFGKNDLGTGGEIMKFFTEFKAPKKTATDNQMDEQKLMRAAGWDGMTECDDIDEFKIWVRAYEQGTCLPQRT